MLKYAAISILIIFGAETLNSAFAQEPTPLVDKKENGNQSKLKPAIDSGAKQSIVQPTQSNLKPCEKTPPPAWCNEKKMK